MVFQGVLLLLGLSLLVFGGTPIGRGSKSILRPPYDRILGAGILLFLIIIRVFDLGMMAWGTIIAGIILLIIAVVCIILSMNEPVR